jgi:hypothetical protein
MEDPKVNVNEVGPGRSSRKRPPPRAPTPKSSYGRSVSPVKYNILRGKASSISTSTSNMEDPKTKVSKVRPAASSRKRSGSEASVAAQKKVKLEHSATQSLTPDPVQKSALNTTPAAREETPLFNKYEMYLLWGAREGEKSPDFEDDQKKLKLGRSAAQEPPQESTPGSSQESVLTSTPAAREETPDSYLEYLVYGAQEDDEAPDSDVDGDNSDLENNDVKSDLETSSNYSDLENNDIRFNLGTSSNHSDLSDDAVEDNIEHNTDLNIPTIESSIEYPDLGSFSFFRLKNMCTDPVSRLHYGDDALFKATWRASFSAMTLKEIRNIPRNAVPEKYHVMFDEIVHAKRLATLYWVRSLRRGSQL